VLGPDLTDVAAIRRADQLKQAVLEPGVAVPDGFRAVEATLVDGSRVQGVAKFENNYTLRILDRGGRLHFLQKKKLADISFKKGSLMPGDYAERLSDGDIGNLLAFLSRQSLRKWEQE
jgi:putative heme-binding domain-containing protein